jgi:uracil-DNA glycosylase family 4
MAGGRRLGLKKLARHWSRCKECVLHHGRRNVVFGESFGKGTGPRVLIIGEAPGAVEDEEGVPFVGPSGKLLREYYLEPAGVDNGFITNTLGCRPPRNRDPARAELESCWPRVRQIAEIYKPQLLVIVGRIADASVTIDSIPRVKVYHPAYILRKGWPSKEARALAEEQSLKIRVELAAISAAEALEEDNEQESVAAGSILFDGELVDHFWVNEETAEFAGTLPRKPPRRKT